MNKLSELITSGTECCFAKAKAASISISLAAFRTLNVPVLYMAGKRSPASSRSVMRLLAPVLPRATLVEFEKLGHMAPLTHPAVVNNAIAEFLQQHMRAP